MKPIDEMTDWEKEQAIHSARYMLEDFFQQAQEGGMEFLATATSLPEGVVHAALENIFCAEIK